MYVCTEKENHLVLRCHKVKSWLSSPFFGLSIAHPSHPFFVSGRLLNASSRKQKKSQLSLLLLKPNRFLFVFLQRGGERWCRRFAIMRVAVKKKKVWQKKFNLFICVSLKCMCTVIHFQHYGGDLNVCFEFLCLSISTELIFSINGDVVAWKWSNYYC